MPTIGWFEILIVVAIAIVVLGPKDFPIMLKKGRFLDWNCKKICEQHTK
jgi:Sec-independent protein translocase protein TatA